MLKKIFNYCIIIFLISQAGAYAQDYKVVEGAMDIHSNISDGTSSLEKIAESAQGKGISVLVFGDCALRKWEYGLWPLRNIVKKMHQENSVLRLGPEKYFKKLKLLEREFPDMLFIPGVETSPFFYWEGSPFEKNFAIIDYYKQFLIIGLKPYDYRNFPIVGNRRFFYFSKEALFGLWPILLIIFGLSYLRKKVWRFYFITIGFIFLFNNLPFPTSRFSVYKGNQGIRPYQELIDYVNKKGGLIFWAHPEMFTQKIYNYKTEFYTAPHLEDLLLTHDYTGFGITDMLKVSEPGSIWDEILLEYIKGKRKKPVWIIGALHYTGQSAKIEHWSEETLFFVKEAKEKDILDALREGRMYVRFNRGEFPAFLSKFSAKTLSSGSIRIIITGNQVPAPEPLKIELIRNGKVFKTFEESRSEWMIAVEDNLSESEKKVYYRLRISNSSSIILSNPIFVES